MSLDLNNFFFIDFSIKHWNFKIEHQIFINSVKISTRFLDESVRDDLRQTFSYSLLHCKINEFASVEFLVKPLNRFQ